MVATIALLCVSSTVLAHDIYSNLRDRDEHLCCNGQDCTPVEATVLPDGNYYLPRTDEVIPAEMATPSPDDRFHHCTYYPVANEFDRWHVAHFMLVVKGLAHVPMRGPAHLLRIELSSLRLVATYWRPRLTH